MLQKAQAIPLNHYCQFLWGLLNSTTATARCYEGLVANLRWQHASRPLRSVLVTSAKPAEGKSTVALALAMALSLSGKRVLLVDADLRKPSLHRLLGIDNSVGLTDLLCGDRTLPDLVRTIVLPGSTGSNFSLDVVTSGPRPANLFETMETALPKVDVSSWGGDFDHVLLDSPPILAVRDALVLSQTVDGTLFVMRPGAVSEKEAGQSRSRLQEAGCHVIGAVLNRFDEKLHGAGHMPYNAYY
jgi:capsular exopolysaccharide synthesis family protein